MEQIEDTVDIQSNEPNVAEIENIKYEDGFPIIEGNSELLEGIEND